MRFSGKYIFFLLAGLILSSCAQQGCPGGMCAPDHYNKNTRNSNRRNFNYNYSRPPSRGLLRNGTNWSRMGRNPTIGGPMTDINKKSLNYNFDKFSNQRRFNKGSAWSSKGLSGNFSGSNINRKSLTVATNNNYNKKGLRSGNSNSYLKHNKITSKANINRKSLATDNTRRGGKGILGRNSNWKDPGSGKKITSTNINKKNIGDLGKPGRSGRMKQGVVPGTVSTLSPKATNIEKSNKTFKQPHQGVFSKMFQGNSSWQERQGRKPHHRALFAAVKYKEPKKTKRHQEGLFSQEVAGWQTRANPIPSANTSKPVKKPPDKQKGVGIKKLK